MVKKLLSMRFMHSWIVEYLRKAHSQLQHLSLSYIDTQDRFLADLLLTLAEASSLSLGRSYRHIKYAFLTTKIIGAHAETITCTCIHTNDCVLHMFRAPVILLKTWTCGLAEAYKLQVRLLNY
eukprot:GHVR01035316.1.p1 GENE.GHVR01035316.1~~GHVR01035316.1.p1  ORF type:complete len:123 (-),score=3.12 GHVR01035316.1:288-656(-)